MPAALTTGMRTGATIRMFGREVQRHADQKDDQHHQRMEESSCASMNGGQEVDQLIRDVRCGNEPRRYLERGRP